MDVLLLGALAVVLIAITVWIVMWPSRGAEPAAPVAQESADLPPQGDRFEDQYTSATADLSAGGVAETLAVQPREEPAAVAPAVSPAALPVVGGPWSRPTLARETAIQPAKRDRAPASLGAAAVLILGGAIGGAMLYSRWQQQRNKPTRRLKRRFLRLRLRLR